MALSDRRHPARWWSRLHFVVRLAGITGVLALATGVALMLLGETPLSLHRESWEGLVSILKGESGDAWSQIAVRLAAAGAVAALLALLVEAINVVRFAAGRRSAFASNAVLQAALAVVILVGLNVYSYRHYLRLDWTRSHRFTLPEDVQERLSRLHDRTTIVVYQQHKTFGRLSDQTNSYDYAAEQKVVEKVQDLVEQFREFGPQFKVIVLDVKEKEDSPGHRKEGSPRGYYDVVASLPDELRQAIDHADENSIFFDAGGKVERLSFNELFQLDKTASQDQSNLVLLDQGIEPFTRKVLDIEEKRPRVAVAVTFEVLTTEGPDMYGLRGLKKALTERGCDVRDIILKRLTPTGTEPAAYTYDESRFGSLELKINVLDALLKDIADQVIETRKRKEMLARPGDEALARAVAVRVAQSAVLQVGSLDDVTKQLLDQVKQMDAAEKAELRRREQAAVDEDLESLAKANDQMTRQRDKRVQERSQLNDESFAEQRRITDVKTKLDRLLADCDLLIIPRMTIVSLAPSLYIPNEVHQLDPAQVKAIQDFMKAGKPVLACFGPINESPQRRRGQPPAQGADGVEQLLGELGITFGKQTIIYDAEAESLAGGQNDDLEVPAAPESVPPVEFRGKAHPGKVLRPNPLRASMRLATRSIGRDLNLEIHYPRPVGYEAPKSDKKPTADAKTAPAGSLALGAAASGNPLGAAADLAMAAKSGAAGSIRNAEVEPEFMLTSPDTWKEDQPFPARGKPLLPTGDKRGPFAIGVAVETALPASWFAGSSATEARPKVRVAAIGHGGWLTGPELTPAKEKLLDDVTNWLLHRDELFARDNQTWSFPRVDLTPHGERLWEWCMRLGLPVLFVYLGLVVFMFRRLR